MADPLDHVGSPLAAPPGKRRNELRTKLDGSNWKRVARSPAGDRPALEVALGHVDHVANDAPGLPLGAAALHVPVGGILDEVVELRRSWRITSSIAGSAAKLIAFNAGWSAMAAPLMRMLLRMAFGCLPAARHHCAEQAGDGIDLVVIDCMLTTGIQA